MGRIPLEALELHILALTLLDVPVGEDLAEHDRFVTIDRPDL